MKQESPFFRCGERQKYDYTSAHADGVLNEDTYVSTGLHNNAVEEALAPYAIQGVVYTYARVADIVTYSAQEADGYKDMVLYALPDNSSSEQFLAALGLSRDDAYRIDHNQLQFIELRRKTPAFNHGDISRSYGRVGRTRTDTPVEIV